MTPAERRLAVQHDRDRAAIERLGVPAASKIGFDLQRAVLAAVRRGARWADIRKIVRPQLAKLRPLVLEGMLAAHLKGRVRTATAAGGQGLSLRRVGTTPHALAIDALKKRAKLTADELDAIQAQYEARALRVLDDATAAVEAELQAALIKTTLAGEHAREGVKAMREAFAAAGITPQNSYTLENLFRTQTQLAYGAARWQAGQDEAVQEILWGYTYVTVGDDRVRPEHAGLDGTTLPKGDPFWKRAWPPNGYSCRCSTIEVFEERAVVQPPAVVEVAGKEYQPGPDKGFAYNAGELFGSLGSAG